MSHDSEWQTVVNKSNKRGRQDNTDKQIDQAKQFKTTSYWLNPTNRFEPLADLEQETSTSKITEPRPPPKFVSGVKSTEPLITYLETVAKDEYTLKALTNDEIKILVNTPEKYRAITKGLIEKNTDFHTYQVKQERSFRAFLRNLHPSTSISGIKD